MNKEPIHIFPVISHEPLETVPPTKVNSTGPTLSEVVQALDIIANGVNENEIN